MSLGLAFLTTVAAGAAEPVARATDYDDVHIRVLDPEKSGGVVRERARRDPSNAPTPGTASRRRQSRAICRRSGMGSSRTRTASGSKW